MRATRRGLGLATLLLAAACTPHPIGPARTFEAYEGKARTTVEAARSNVETVRLVIEADGDGHTTATYTAMVVSEQEDALSGVDGTFGSIQPPDAEADDLRGEVGDLLGTALDHVASARIAARRGGGEELQRALPALEDDAAALTAFLEDHGG